MHPFEEISPLFTANRDKNVDEVIAIYNILDVKKAILKEIETQYQNAHTYFGMIPVEEERKQTLISLTDQLKVREI